MCADLTPCFPSGVLMSRPKQVGRHGGECWAFTATATAAAVLQADMISPCLSTLKALLAYWKSSVLPPRSGQVMDDVVRRGMPSTSACRASCLL